jgi:isorenieratene synthase
MKYEYLLFNALILGLPLLCGLIPAWSFRSGWKKATFAAIMISIPYLIWDISVTGAHWEFNRSFTLNNRFYGLPPGEILFFFTVPFACMYMWEMIFAGRKGKISSFLSLLRVGWMLLVLPGCWLFVQGKEYTGLMLCAVAVSAMADRWLRTDLLLQWRGYAYLGIVSVCTLLFNGYLTARPVVLYNASVQLDVRIWTIPVEDFGYGISLVLLNLSVYERLQGRAYDPTHRSLFARWVERVFGGYRHQVNVVDAALPRELNETRRVAIIGSGLAGLSAAVQLSDRGYKVHVFEKNEYLGGKVGSWKVSLPDEDGNEVEQTLVSHGFHAFFRHYYNLNELLEKVDCAKHLIPIDDYLILDQKGGRFSFKNVLTPPVLNLISLAMHGVYSLSRVALSPSGRKLESFLQYHREGTPEAFDHMSFADFAKEAKLPSDLKMIFNTFSRAFFAEADRMSMAELIKSFHFYYLSHDHGLIYDYLDDDYTHTLLNPIQSYIEERGGTVSISTPVAELEREGEQWRVNGELFDSVVLAADVAGAKALVEQSESVKKQYPQWHQQICKQHPSQRYSVLRLWVDRDVDEALSPFFITEKVNVLDAVSVYHRLEKSSREWVEKNGGAILELHCYAVPDALPDDEAIRDGLLEEFYTYFPDMRGMTIHHEHLQVRRDFAAFHTGMWKERPSFDTGVPGMYLAGDWVKMPIPAMLMEGAAVSGLLSANAMFRSDGLQEEPVYSVPEKGLLQLLMPSRSKAPVKRTNDAQAVAKG